ncbi:MAG: hypothetical protein OXG71_11925 [Rhodospirillales bacterium]|nr:hypothetical protein [Rhodospirillales bacterium]
MGCWKSGLGFLTSAAAVGLGIAGVVTGPVGWVMLGAFTSIMSTGVSAGAFLTCLAK